MKITIHDLYRARACVQWLKENVGPALPHAGGSHVRGTGWHYWLSGINSDQVDFEVDEESVDHNTVVLFALKWSQ